MNKLNSSPLSGSRKFLLDGSVCAKAGILGLQCSISVDLGHAVVDLSKYKGQNISIELHVVFHTNTPKGNVMGGIHETIIEGRVSAPKPSKK